MVFSSSLKLGSVNLALAPTVNLTVVTRLTRTWLSNTCGALPDTSLFGSPSFESSSIQHVGAPNVVIKPAVPANTASVYSLLVSSATDHLAAAATAASPAVIPRWAVSAHSLFLLAQPSSSSSLNPPSQQPNPSSSPLHGSESPSF
ncbi:hypothetical protein PC123_g9364 [Phytophthora cactorum]|nr:hypothetical protein PC123_g9364 [Phytophthora cactorum]